ncbi:HEAT repeat domain-containing protein [Brevibacterium yomogidense]|uniref:HEAT repeat domain-containing protein n=1 Tax=Brevibacterium yomogidense TaxID=946573 RepID=UPI0018DF6D9D|nr:HEAT repeat domain-containing protein [Brevibacterium yomogidense]
MRDEQSAAREDLPGQSRLIALAATDPSARLRAALDAGTRPDPDAVALLVDRCAVEPDFFVRDMLTWALTRHQAAATVPLLLDALGSAVPQARSQALHTLSKIGDPAAWSHLSEALLCDEDDEAARAAWRAAVVLVPDAAEPWLADVLTTQLGRGDAEVQKSLSRALVALDDAAEAPLTRAAASPHVSVRVHAEATRRLLEDPDAGFAGVIEEAKRVVALGALGLDG